MKIAESVLVAAGNYPLFPSGQAVWNAPVGKKSPTLNVLPGQIVIYSPITNLSLGVAATVETNPEIVVAVGVSRGKNGAADFLLSATGQKIVGCGIEAITARGPLCGVPEIKDLLFSCVDANEPYTVTVKAWDSRIRGEYDYNRWAEYVFTRSVTAGGCADCVNEDYSKQLACELERAINGDIPAGWDVSKNGKYIYPADIPFSASRLFEYSTIWCLTNSEITGCEDCTTVSRVSGIRTAAGAITDFTNSANPGNQYQTLNAQLEGIVEQINTYLDGNGTATLIASGTPCCPFSIEINTCIEDIILVATEDVDDVATEVDMTPCGAATNPLTIDAPASTCTTCEEGEAGTLTYPAGIRIISKPVDVHTGCYIPQPGTTYVGRKIGVFPVGGFKPGTYAVIDIQNARNATNQGFQLIQMEYRSNLVGGPGRLGRPFNSRTGRYGLPLAGDRLTTTLTNQNEAYCVYNIEHTRPQNGVSYHGDRNHPKQRTRIFVPVGDTITATDLTAFLNAYGSSAPCKIIAVECGNED